MAAPPQGSEQAPSFSSPQEEALLTLLRAADHANRAMQQRLKPSGLTATQYNVLRILRGARPAGLTCSAIGSRMIAAEPDITRLLGRLEKQKLLRRQRDGHDRRVVWTQITEKGLSLLAELDGLVERAPKEVLKDLSGAELKELMRLLKKMQCCAEGRSAVQTGEPAVGTPVSGKRPFAGSPRRHPLE